MCVREWLLDRLTEPGCPSLPSLGLLLQDAPLSDCTDTIDGLDVSEGSYSPAKSIRKVLNRSSLHPYFMSSSSHPSLQIGTMFRPIFRSKKKKKRTEAMFFFPSLLFLFSLVTYSSLPDMCSQRIYTVFLFCASCVHVKVGGV